MRKTCAMAGLLMGTVWCVCVYATNPETPDSKEVTLTGAVMCNWSTLPDPKSTVKQRVNEEHDQLVVYAMDGSPEIKGEVDKIVADYYPEKGLTGDEAQKLQEQWTARLKFYIAKEGVGGAKLYARRHDESSFGFTLTGIVSEKDGKKWITANKCSAEVLPQDFAKHYPKKFMLPDKPFVMPDKEPLMLKVTDTLSLKCYKLPPGKYQEGSFFFMVKRFPEEYPHLVTLTKPFYLAEIPVTQEMYESVMGANPSKEKGAQLPVRDVSCVDRIRFCQILSKKNGRNVRLPTDAEWEYAARMGVSNPGPPELFVDQDSSGPKRTGLPVKSKQPNAWGFYDLHSSWWEIVADRGFYNPRTSQVDQFFPPVADEARVHDHRGRGLIAYNHLNANVEFMRVPDPNFYAGVKFRLAVDVEPVATAAGP